MVPSRPIDFLPPSYYNEGREKFLTALSDPALRRKVRAEVEAENPQWENWFHHVGRDWDKVLITGSGDFPDKRIAGLSVAQAESAVSMLQGDQLRQAAGQARAVNQDLAGGATVVITTTTIIIILLVIILIAVIA